MTVCKTPNVIDITSPPPVACVTHAGTNNTTENTEIQRGLGVLEYAVKREIVTLDLSSALVECIRTSVDLI
jgi:hypothetical protein